MIMRASSWKRQLAVPWTMKEREGPRPAYKPAARLCGRRHQRTNERQWQTEKSLCDWDLGYANHSLDCKLLYSEMEYGPRLGTSGQGQLTCDVWKNRELIRSPHVPNSAGLLSHLCFLDAPLLSKYRTNQMCVTPV